MIKSSACLFTTGLLLSVAAARAAPFAYIANSGSNTVSVIDTSSNTVVATVSGGTQPGGAAVNPSGTRVYMVKEGSNSVSVIDTSSNAIVARIHVGTTPVGVAVNPAETRAYVSNFLEGSIIRAAIEIDTHPQRAGLSRFVNGNARQQLPTNLDLKAGDPNVVASSTLGSLSAISRTMSKSTLFLGISASRLV